MRCRFGLAAILWSLVVPAVIAAHPDHEHRITGIVVSVTAQQIEIKDGDKIIVIRVNDETKYGRGRNRASLADVKVGEQIAADVTSENPPFTAKEVVLKGLPKPPKTKKNAGELEGGS